jgi:hypothetical protein
MKSSRYIGSAAIAALLMTAVTFASQEEQQLEHKRLYTPPDPSATGGIRGSIETPAGTVCQVLAIPSSNPEKVYRGEFSDGNRCAFLLNGLPMDRYDLVVIFENTAYEGLRLTRAENTLTAQDLQQIGETVQRSEPFFTIKTIHRVEGETGRGNLARAFCTFARDREAEMYAGPVKRKGMRRTNKLVMLQQVGPGWQIARSRDLFPIWIEANEAQRLRPAHQFRPALSGIRVTDQMRDIGALSL